MGNSEDIVDRDYIRGKLPPKRSKPCIPLLHNWQSDSWWLLDVLECGGYGSPLKIQEYTIHTSFRFNFWKERHDAFPNELPNGWCRSIFEGKTVRI